MMGRSFGAAPFSYAPPDEGNYESAAVADEQKMRAAEN